MALLVAGELVFGAWLAAQVAAWLRSPAAQQMAEALELGDHVRPLLRYLARWHPLPDRIDELLQEAQEDAPRNAYVALALGALLALLQPLAALLALLAARAPASRARSASLVPLHPRPPSYDSGWARRVAACCVTYVIKIYYKEKNVKKAQIDSC
ncbi:uncharacterized protein LOC135117118 isoform X1 [Helicoverpa armigera]|uniref:uncharacterized protein LOC135117118 isoform X1 n=1 Tax=Helicoverpa armigera TaxID=29058 RepID=UPI003083BA5E